LETWWIWDFKLYLFLKNVMFLAFYPMQNGENLPPKNDINSMLQEKFATN
jgi:hypothetical protein